MLNGRLLNRPTADHPSALLRRMRSLVVSSSITLFAVMLLSVYFQPVAFMTVGSLKQTQEYFASPDRPLLPAAAASYSYQGTDYPLYEVPADQGMQRWALVQPGRRESLFVDPLHPERGLIAWQGSWRSLDQVWVLQPQWQNYPAAWQETKLGSLIRNSLLIALVGTAASILTSLPVAYGFARFRLPGK